MKVSKICSKATYHKCIRELNDFGYLSYHPSYNPFKGSLVYLFDFNTSAEPVQQKHTIIGTSTEQAVNGEHTKIGTSTEQALVPYINNTNINKQKTKVNKRELSLKNSDESKNEKIGKEKSSAQKEKFISPQISEVQEYFASQKFSPIEAEKFFSHFTSNGWLVAGKTPMKNWKAASNKWIINSRNFSQKRNSPSSSTVSTKKNYNEPL